jgi:HEAT repeat protein
VTTNPPGNQQPATGNLPDTPKESPRTILFQFVIFPMGVVLIGVAVFLLFGKLASNEQSIPDYLSDIRSGSSHRKFQAAYELSKSIKRGEAKRYPNLVEQVIDVYRTSKTDDPRVRQYLTLVLGKLGDRRAVPVLIDALKDPVVETRIYALIALAELQDPESVPAVIAAAKDDDKDVRKTAIYALGALHDPRGLPLLEEALNDPVADIRYNAALGLARAGDHRAEPVLRTMIDRASLNRVSGMRPEQKEEAMVAAIPAYAQLAGKNAAPELQALAGSDESMRVRAAAKEALEKLR